jgi:CheY-like chemotaxis protein
MSDNLKILLADDAKFFVAIEKQFLRKTPAQVIEAHSAEEAVALTRLERPALVVMAYSLRPEGGIACCKAIKGDPELKSIPVIMVCDKGEDDQITKCKLAGCNGVVIKPLDQHEFLQVGRQFLPSIREPRQTCLHQVEFEWQGVLEKCKSLDLSSGGLFADSQTDIPVGTELSLKLVLPDAHVPALQLKGEVAWLNRRPNPIKPQYPVGFGVRFTGLTSELNAILGRLIKR